MKCLVSVFFLNSFVLSKHEYTGTVVRESDEVYSEETFEHFSNSTWIKKNDNLKIKETEGGQGHVLQMFTSMTGDETGILESKVTLPGDCDSVAILYISFKLFLSGNVDKQHFAFFIIFTKRKFRIMYFENPFLSLP